MTKMSTPALAGSPLLLTLLTVTQAFSAVTAHADELPPSTTIVLDGSLDEWAPIASAGAGVDVPDAPGNDVDLLALKMAHDDDTLFLAYENEGPVTLGWHYALFVDTDRNPGSGYSTGGVGVDYLIEGSTLYQYTGSGSDWSWQYVRQLDSAASGNTAELSIPRTLLGTGASLDFFFLGQAGLEAIPQQPGALAYAFDASGVFVDGNLEDWTAIDSLGAGLDVPDAPGNDVDLLALKLTHDEDTLFVAYQNEGSVWLDWSYALYIDADRNPATGFATGSIGADYLIEGKAAYQYTGSGSDWSWQYVQQLSSAASGNTAELAIPRALLGTGSGIDFFFFGQGGLETIPQLPGALAYAFDARGIFVDGSLDDWSSIGSVGAGVDVPNAPGNDVDLLALKLTHDDSALFVAYENEGPVMLGWAYALYIDADRNPDTGFTMKAWGAAGADYLIEGNVAYQYTGSGFDWSWQYLQQLNSAVNGNTAELSIPRALMGSNPAIDYYFVGQGGCLYCERLPNGSGYLSYALELQANTAPVAVSTQYATQQATAVGIELRGFDADADALGFNIETQPAGGSLSGAAPSLTYTPDADFVGVDSFSFTVSDGLASSTTATVTISVQRALSNDIVLDGKLDDWSSIPSLGSGLDVPDAPENQVDLLELKLTHNDESLFVAYHNESPIVLDANYILYIDTDNDSATGWAISGIGADLLIQGVQAYQYTGSGTDWSWAYMQQLDSATDGNTAELQMPRTLLGTSSSLDYVFKGQNGLESIPTGESPVLASQEYLSYSFGRSARVEFASHSVETELSYRPGPRVEVDSKGNAFAIWVHTDYSTSSVWVNRYTPQAGWGRPQALDPEQPPFSTVTGPRIRLDAAGNAMAFWTRDSGNWGNLGIHASYYSVLEGAWSTPAQIDTLADRGGPQWLEDFVFDADGNGAAIGMVTGYAGGAEDIWVNHFDPAQGWSNSQRVSELAAGRSRGPKLGVDDAGNLVAIWCQRDINHGDWEYKVWSNHYVPGAGWGTAARVTAQGHRPANRSQNPFDVELRVSPSGDAVVAWASNPPLNDPESVTDLWAARYTASEGTWTPAESIEDLSGTPSTPALLNDAAGNVVTVWTHSNGAEADLFANRYDATVGSWGSAEPIEGAAGTASIPELGIDREGNTLAIWTQTNGTETGVFANRYDTTAGSWGSAEAIHSHPGSASMPRLAVDALGDAIAVWTQSDGSHDKLFAIRYDAAGNAWGSAEPLEDKKGDASSAWVTYGPPGGALVVWTQRDGSSTDLWAHQFAPLETP